LAQAVRATAHKLGRGRPIAGHLGQILGKPRPVVGLQSAASRGMTWAFPRAHLVALPAGCWAAGMRASAWTEHGCQVFHPPRPIDEPSLRAWRVLPEVSVSASEPRGAAHRWVLVGVELPRSTCTCNEHRRPRSQTIVALALGFDPQRSSLTSPLEN